MAKVHLRFLDYWQWPVLSNGRRTLHRRLSAEDTNFLSLLHSAEDTNFLSLLQSVRAELASRQILESDRSLAELADLLGFSSPSAFALVQKTLWHDRVGGQASQVAENPPSNRG
ncbi:helix-turn-helix domain-containing protein [Cupriavidus necator]|uniref:helix-turn-helix domain-containing protein n=1 Tax=Cupriavidus necator TaxID=106590 RepID=UPI001925E505|nr:helix-turn-helix domain-containing protein [Cupriavidus necator]QQX87641.1 helix-turn-helix domain-containing protein [Cupriavidus necator]